MPINPYGRAEPHPHDPTPVWPTALVQKVESVQLAQKRVDELRRVKEKASQEYGLACDELKEEVISAKKVFGQALGRQIL
jgi:hypothetical protein